MAINYAEKYSPKVQERFSLGSITDKYCGHDYEFTGIKTLKVYSVNTVPLVDYQRSGTSRYGTPTDLGDTIQEMVMGLDKGFSYVIDAGDAGEQFNIKQGHSTLKREIDEEVTPFIDKHRFAQWVAGNGLSDGFEILSGVDGSLTKTNIIEKIFTAGATMSENKVPRTNRAIFIPELEFIKFKLAEVVMGGSDKLTTENIRQGYKGTLDGMAVITAPSSYFPEGVNFIIKHKSATVDPVKLQSYHTHKNPPGISGTLVEGRIIFDSFVLDSKCKGIYVSKVA